jgi:hypothetical protein
MRPVVTRQAAGDKKRDVRRDAVISPYRRAHFVSTKPKGAIRHARQSVAAIRAPLAFALQEPLCARDSRTRATSTL